MAQKGTNLDVLDKTGKSDACKMQKYDYKRPKMSKTSLVLDKTGRNLT